MAHPLTVAADAVPDRSVDRVVAERGVIGADQLYRLTGERRPPQLGNLVVDPAVLDAWTAEVRAAVHDAGGKILLRSYVDHYLEAYLRDNDMTPGSVEIIAFTQRYDD